MVGPNASFLRYIGDVLPALGEIDAQQTTIEELVGETLSRLSPRYAVRGDDAARRGHPQGRRPAGRGAPPGAVVARPGARRGAAGAARRPPVAAGALRGGGGRSPSCAPAGSGTAPRRGMLAQRLAHAMLVKMESPATRPTTGCRTPWRAAARCKRYVDQVWPAVDPARLVLRLLGDAGLLAAAADGLLSDEEQALLLLGQAAQGPDVGALVAGRRRPGRRGRRPGRAHPLPRATWSPTRRRTSRR